MAEPSTHVQGSPVSSVEAPYLYVRPDTHSTFATVSAPSLESVVSLALRLRSGDVGDE